MGQRITSEETRIWFAEHMKRQPGYGLGPAICNLLLAPRNPFHVSERRKFRAGFLFWVAWLGAGAALFVFFSCLLERP